MVAAARKAGCSAKFTGSGGAIIGTYPDEDALVAMRANLAEFKADVIIPRVEPSHGD
jgi:glucuronokinase